QLVLRDELRRGEEVDDELDRLVHAVRRGQGLTGLPGLGHARAKRRKRRFPLGHGLVKVADVTNPSNELSASGRRSLRDRSSVRTSEKAPSRRAEARARQKV